jgi:hypothetical protein
MAPIAPTTMTTTTAPHVSDEHGNPWTLQVRVLSQPRHPSCMSSWSRTMELSLRDPDGYYVTISTA